MKIVITAPSYYPEKDGVQQVTKNYAENLVKKGIDVLVICPLINSAVEQEVISGVRIMRVPLKTKYGLYFGDAKNYRKIVISETRDADALINMCTQTATTDFLYKAIGSIKCKKILWMHGMYDFKWHKTDFSSVKIFVYKIWRDIVWRFRYLRDGKYFKQYTHIVQLHDFDSATTFFKKHYDIESLVFENSPDDCFFSARKSNKKDFSDGKYAICVANYIERKNQAFLIRAIYKSNNKIPLVLIGSKQTKYYHKLVALNNSLSQKNGTDLVTFYDGLDREKTCELIINSDLVIMGSLWEAYPISLVESMACGIPFISTDVGIAKYLPGGLIVKDPKSMAYWIDLLNSMPELFSYLGKCGRKYAEKRLSINTNVERLLDTIKDN